MYPACAVSRVGALPMGARQIGVPMFVSPGPTSCRRGLCMIGILVVLLLGIWFFWTPSRRTYRDRQIADSLGVYGETLQPQGADVSGATVPVQAGVGTPLKPAQTAAQKVPTPTTSDSARPFNEPAGALPATQVPLSAATGRCQNPQAPEPVPATAGNAMVMMPSVPGSLPEAPKVSAALAGDGGWTLDANTFAPSQDSEDYYKHFKPVSLEATMPMGWRAAQDPAKCASGEENIYSEFSRYAISPNQMKRAENMRSVLRLGELSRDGLSRTLGQRSLLRDFVTPLGPNPVGDSAMLWNDSSVRQNYIASATGRFPDVAQSC